MGSKTIDDLELHDSGFEGFNLDLLNKEVQIFVSFYNEESKDYDLTTLCFFDIGNFNCSEFKLDDQSSIEINSAKVFYKDNKQFIKLILLDVRIHFPTETYIISFSFGSYTAK